MYRVLVTGATGLLGANIVRSLIDSSWHVRVLVRNGSSTDHLNDLPVEIFKGMITDENDIDNAVSGCDYVIHAAALTSQAPGDLRPFIEINVNTVTTIIGACRRHSVRRLVFVSTANCFTCGTISKPGNEKGGFMPWLRHSNYALSKRMAQDKVLHEVKENGFDAVVVAPCFLLGPYDLHTGSGKLLLYAMRKSFLFYPPGGKSFTDAEYAAMATVNALTSGPPGEVYLLAGENLSYREFFKKISVFRKIRPLLIPLPSVALYTAAAFCSLLNLFLTRKIPLTFTNARMLCTDNYFSGEKASHFLALKKTSAGDAAAKAIGWFRQNSINMS